MDVCYVEDKAWDELSMYDLVADFIHLSFPSIFNEGGECEWPGYL